MIIGSVLPLTGQPRGVKSIITKTMPKTVYDEEGNQIEVPTDEELEEMKKAKEEKEQVEEEKQKKEDELEQTKSELSKLQNKDFNFKKLRDMNEEEKAKLTEAERQLKQKQEELEEQQQQWQEKVVESHKNEALMALGAANDEETKKKVLDNYERIKGEAHSKEEVYQKMRDAVNMTKGAGDTSGNPLFQAHNVGGSHNDENQNKDKKEVNKELAKKFNLSEDDLEKYLNNNK